MAIISRTSDKDREALRRAAMSRDQGPTEEQAAYNRYPLQQIFQETGIADPRNATRRPSFPFLREMRDDHMISMGLHFIAMPLIRAAWYVESEDAQIAAFLDKLLRPIYGSLMLTLLRFLWAGYSPAVKNYEAVNPSWRYIPSLGADAVKVWNQPNVAVLAFKPVTPLRPENALPRWSATGSFNGIGYDSAYGGPGYFVLNGQQRPNVDLLHSVWATHNQEDRDGDPFGYPRVAHVAPIFHMYKYIWTLMGHAFEDNADPGPVVRYPQDETPRLDSNGSPISNVKTALRIGRRKRGGSTVALPSDPYVDFQDKPTGIKKWDIEYPKSVTDFTSIQGFVNFLEAAKLRGLWLPEQGIVEGSGGQCVAADTPVDCPRDHRRYPAGVPISELKPGQLIWAFNQYEERFELWPVKDVWKTKHGSVLKLTLDDGSVIRATPDHLFLRRDNTWAELRDLCPGDSLMHLLRDFERELKKRRGKRSVLDPIERERRREAGRRNGQARFEGMTADERRHLWHHERDRPCLDGCVFCVREHMLATNHRVVSIEPAGSEDVWDLSVDGPSWVHSFVSLGAVLHNSNRNVAEEFGNQRDESQAVLMSQLDSLIDKVFFKPALAMHFPNFEGEATKKTFGLGQDDEDVVRQLLQLAGQQPGGLAHFGADVRRIVEARGYPMLDAKAQAKMLEQAVQEQAVQPTPTVTPTQGRRALVTQTGFDETMYVQLEAVPSVAAEFGGAALADDSFVSSLPRNDVFGDAKIVATARSLRRDSLSFLSWLYRDFAMYVGKQKSFDLGEELGLALTEAQERGDEFADPVRGVVDKIISGWRPKAERLSEFSKTMRSALGRAFDRTVGIHFERLGYTGVLRSVDKDAAAWLDEHGAERVQGIIDTTRDQLAEVLADGVRESKTMVQIAKDVREHFDSFPATRANAIARTEVSSAYNFATASAGVAAGVAKSQLIDGEKDEPCKSRNGRVVDTKDALNERLAHTNCTLTIRLLPRSSANLTVTRTPLEGFLARYDEETETILLDPTLDDDRAAEWLVRWGDLMAVPEVV